MVKLIKMVPRGLFTKEQKKTTTNQQEEANLTQVKASKDDKSVAESIITSVTISDELKKVLDELSNEDIESKINRLERNYLFEQSNLIEEFEQEKKYMLESFKQQKLLMNRAFENEKIELLKEIERKEKMLFQLTIIMREEHENKLSLQKQELMQSIGQIDETKNNLRQILNNLNEIIYNNKISFKDLRTFENLETQFQTLFNTIKLTENIGSKLTYGDLDVFLSSSQLHKKEEIKCDAINDDIDAALIQQELGQAHKKQKNELLKLFAKEKEEYISQLEKEKKQFEKDTRLEYESRMIAERKAWQDAIEDYEREIAILKYEREQMDRNYCIGMDELKMEFEREKMSLYHLYSVTHSEYGRSLSDKSNESSKLIYSN